MRHPYLRRICHAHPPTGTPAHSLRTSPAAPLPSNPLPAAPAPNAPHTSANLPHPAARIPTHAWPDAIPVPGPSPPPRPSPGDIPTTGEFGIQKCLFVLHLPPPLTAVELQEGLLHCILRIVRVPQQCVGDTKHQVLPASNQRGECVVSLHGLLVLQRFVPFTAVARPDLRPNTHPTARPSTCSHPKTGSSGKPFIFLLPP